MPISDTITCAVRSLTPGMLHSRRTASRKGSRSWSTASSISAKADVQGIDLTQVQTQQEAVAVGHASLQAACTLSRGAFTRRSISISR